MDGQEERPLHCRNCQLPLPLGDAPYRMVSGDHALCLQCMTNESTVNEMLHRGSWEILPSAPPQPLEVIAHASRLLGADLSHLAARQREFLLRTLDAVTGLKMRLEAELSAPPPISPPPPPSPSPLAALADLERLHTRRTSAAIRCRLYDLVGSSLVLLDFDLMRRALLGYYQPERGEPADPMLFLANFCAAQEYMRTCLQRPDDPLLRMPPTHPLFYFDLEMGGMPCGRFVVEVRDDLAPVMARNFALLCTGELGVGYRGCTVFQCWQGESVITGDFEHNNGRGGRSVYDAGFFTPDDTRLAAVRGAVGMRRSQRRRKRNGQVGSQFRVILREMQGFTAIFGHVVEGIEMVEQLSCTGNGLGQPHTTILITGCGKLK